MALTEYKNVIAEHLQHVRFECRYEGLVTIGLEGLQEKLAAISRPVISNMVRKGNVVDAASLRAAGLNAYDWELALGVAPIVETKMMTITPPPSPIQVPIIKHDIEDQPFVPIMPAAPVATLDVEPPLEVKAVRRGARKSKKGL